MNNLQSLLTELKRLEREATPGKWAYAYEYTCLVALDKNINAYEQGTKGSPSGYHEHEIDLDSGASNNDKSESNGQFIASLRNASPVLIECLELVLSSIENDTYLELTELDAICEQENASKPHSTKDTPRVRAEKAYASIQQVITLNERISELEKLIEIKKQPLD